MREEEKSISLKELAQIVEDVRETWCRRARKTKKICHHWITDTQTGVGKHPCRRCIALDQVLRKAGIKPYYQIRQERNWIPEENYEDGVDIRKLIDLDDYRHIPQLGETDIGDPSE